MAAEDVGLAHPIIGEKAIGRFGVGPILPNERNALPHGTSDLLKQLAEALAKPRILKFAPLGFSINPVAGLERRTRIAPGGAKLLCHRAPLSPESGALQ